jgi:hypothetical protein
MLAHSLRVAQSIFRESVIKFLSRSSRWPEARNTFLKTHACCAACGGTNRLQVHHIRPFADAPQFELDPTNFIVLCMGSSECHLVVGHSKSFKFFNPNVRVDAANILANPELFDEIVEKAFTCRKPNIPGE